MSKLEQRRSIKIHNEASYALFDETNGGVRYADYLRRFIFLSLLFIKFLLFYLEGLKKYLDHSLI